MVIASGVCRTGAESFYCANIFKAYGMASLRVGYWRARPSTCRVCARLLALQREWSGAGLPAGGADRSEIRSQVCDRRCSRAEAGWKKNFAAGNSFWPSQANFVLARIGRSHAEFVQGMRAHGILVRDRSSDFGCEGCVRITPAGGSIRTSYRRTARTLKEIGWEKSCGMRQATIERKTQETAIRAVLNIDGRGQYKVSTGIRFFDHMLELFARHGGLTLSCGRRAISMWTSTIRWRMWASFSERRFTRLWDRNASLARRIFVMPMDETLGLAAVDLAGGHPVLSTQKCASGWWAICRQNLCTTSSKGFARGAAPTFMPACCMDAPTITRSKRCSRHSRGPCGRLLA